MALEKVTNDGYTGVLDVKTFLKEYDDIVVGRKKTFSAALMSKHNGPALCASVLRSIFSTYFHWTPTQIRDCLTPEIADRMGLLPLINRIPAPPEIIRDQEMYFVAWYLYPETRNSNDAELVCKVYQDLMTGKIQKFPKNYFDDNIGNSRARLLFMIMLREYFSGAFESVEDMYLFFSSDGGRKAVEEHKLKTPMMEWYGNSLEYLHDSLPDDMKTPASDRLYYRLRDERNDDKDSKDSRKNKKASSNKTAAPSPKMGDVPTSEPASSNTENESTPAGSLSAFEEVLDLE